MEGWTPVSIQHEGKTYRGHMKRSGHKIIVYYGHLAKEEPNPYARTPDKLFAERLLWELVRESLEQC
jgi:hypothetical protein